MGIIRRKVTKNYTTIGNEVFKDERLFPDALGILLFLRSKQNDWEVRRSHLMKRFGLGRDRMRKVVWNWLSTGWVVATRVRLDNGQMDVIYDVYDEPGPGLTDEEIRALFSAESPESCQPDAGDRVRATGCGSPGAETRTRHSIISTEEENTEGQTPLSPRKRGKRLAARVRGIRSWF